MYILLRDIFQIRRICRVRSVDFVCEIPETANLDDSRHVTSHRNTPISPTFSLFFKTCLLSTCALLSSKCMFYFLFPTLQNFIAAMHREEMFWMLHDNCELKIKNNKIKINNQFWGKAESYYLCI